MIATASILDRLPASQPCLGAVVTSYAFDPRVFEERVLRAVLELRSDPTNQTPRFLAEGRAKLRTTPVCAIVDAGQRLPGRRMPYDVLEVAGEVFHPKTTLLLYEDHARLQIGSANVTQGGFGNNAELLVLLVLRYDDPSHRALLRRFDEFLGRCAARAHRQGTQLSLVRAELERRLAVDAAPSPEGLPHFALIDSTLDRPVLDQIFELLPEGATVTRVGLLAPFFETDGEGSSIFDHVHERVGPAVTVDVGMAWDNPSPVREDPETSPFDAAPRRLWCWRYDDESATVEYFVPTRMMRTRYECIDQWGEARQWSIEEAEATLADGRLWPIEPLQAYAPARILRRAADRFEHVRAWLFPATTLHEGRPRHQPLHAKLVVVGFEHEGSSQTLVVVGSANLSHNALLRTTSHGGNVEYGVAWCLEGEHHLCDFHPSLVHVPLDLLELHEREHPDVGTHYGLFIERALHDPQHSTLDVTWDRGRSSADLPAWELFYGDERLAHGEGIPSEDLHTEGFELRLDDAELVLHVGDKRFAIPIDVTDLALLPVHSVELELSLHTMLLMLSGRLGEERAVALEERARQVQPAGAQALGLEAIFGEHYGHTDVFRAWWGACAKLSQPTLSVAGFRVDIVGNLGLRAVWSKMRSTAPEESKRLPPSAVWFYGAELLRELRRIPLDDSPTSRAKAEILDPFVAQLLDDLAELAPSAANEPWARHVLDFYGVPQ